MSTKKQVWQYKCDFCGKKNYSASHMKRHEEHCTKNINRKCRMCEMAGTENNLTNLMNILSDPQYGKVETYWNSGVFEESPFALENSETIKREIEILKIAADGCPACVLAAIRLKNINVRATNFDFKSECKVFWGGVNDRAERGFY